MGASTLAFQTPAASCASCSDDVRALRVGDVESLRHYVVAHDIPGRLRLRLRSGAPGPAAWPRGRREALAALPVFASARVTVSPRTGSIVALYDNMSVRTRIFLQLGALAAAEPGGRQKYRQLGRIGPVARSAGVAAPPVPQAQGAFNPVPGKARSFFYPRLINYAVAVWRAIPYIFTGLKALLRGRLDLDVLDAAALVVCLLRRDFRALSAITFFFSLGEYLADWTRKKSRADLSESLSLNIDHVWIRCGDSALERKAPLSEVRAGDEIVVRAGSALPVDGTVTEGQGMVNQASMTGEALPVPRGPGATVYAGTILEEGELVVAATKVGGQTRINAILRSIEESESAKAAIQGRYELMADAIVPYNFLLAGTVYAASRDPMRAGSVLLVDYSCAIRLAPPLTMFTGMREAAGHGVLIKGGKFMEAVAEADVVVFDKTGTLTEARPVVVDVIPFGGRSADEVLRLAACLEEHFAHPVGQAVVRAAEARNLKHREEHTKVKLIVAHGIVSHWRGRRVLVGSEHFVLEDEGVPLTAEQRAIVDRQSALGRSVLYLAMDGEVAGILLIEDKLRGDAPAVVRALRADGVKKVIMLTGDSELTAKAIAASAGVDEYRSQLLPEHKADAIAELRRQGCKVLMVGDGINDSPALSAANVGAAMAEGADLAREVADIVLLNGRLDGLLLARAVSRAALFRVRANFRASLFWNSLFLMGGLIGVLRPGLAALLHNASTAAIAVRSIRPLLEGADEKIKRKVLCPPEQCGRSDICRKE